MPKKEKMGKVTGSLGCRKTTLKWWSLVKVNSLQISLIFRDVSEDFGSFSHQEESVLEKEEENKQLRMGSQCCGSRLLLNHQ